MSKLLLVAALVASGLILNTQAADKPAAEAGPAQVQKGQRGDREGVKVDREAMIAKRLEAIKAQDEAKYKELVELRQKDPRAFREQMRALAPRRKQGEPGAKGEGDAPARRKPKAE